MNDDCFYCNKEIDGNTPLILRKLTNIGYQDMNFCSTECFIKELEKKGIIVRILSEMKINNLIRNMGRYIFFNSDITEKELTNYIKTEFLPNYEKLKHEELKK